jgi:hypothetical protein
MQPKTAPAVRPLPLGVHVGTHLSKDKWEISQTKPKRQRSVFKRLLAPILEAVGPYPHAELHAMTNGRKKQAARLIKCECAKCGHVARVARQWIDDQGAPHCPAHGEMTVA